MNPKEHLTPFLHDGVIQRGKHGGLSPQDLSWHSLTGLHGVIGLDSESTQQLKAEMEMRKASGNLGSRPKSQNPSLCLTHAQSHLLSEMCGNEPGVVFVARQSYPDDPEGWKLWLVTSTTRRVNAAIKKLQVPLKPS